MPGIKGEEDEHPARSNAVTCVSSIVRWRQTRWWLRHTQEDDCNGNQDHQDMMVAEKRYQALYTHREPDVGHSGGRNGLPAV